MLAEGSRAPDFSLQGSDGKTHKLGDYRGKTVVLYFYPKDDTPGCTIEARNFTKSVGELAKLGAVALGVSKDDLDSHARFIEKYKLKITLLSDPDSKVIKAYDSYGDKGIFGWGTIRNTFIIDKQGRIAKVFKKVHPDGHDREVIAALSVGFIDKV